MRNAKSQGPQVQASTTASGAAPATPTILGGDTCSTAPPARGEVLLAQRQKGQLTCPRRGRTGRCPLNHPVAGGTRHDGPSQTCASERQHPRAARGGPGGRDAMTHGTRAARRGGAGWPGAGGRSGRRRRRQRGLKQGENGSWGAGSREQPSRQNCGGGVRESGRRDPSSAFPPPQLRGVSAGLRSPPPYFLRLLPPPPPRDGPPHPHSGTRRRSEELKVRAALEEVAPGCGRTGAAPVSDSRRSGTAAALAPLPGTEMDSEIPRERRPLSGWAPEQGPGPVLGPVLGVRPRAGSASTARTRRWRPLGRAD